MTHSFKDQKCTSAAVWRAHRNFFTQFQKEDMTLQQHVEKFNESVKTLENVGMVIGADEPSHQNDNVYSDLRE